MLLVEKFYARFSVNRDETLVLGSERFEIAVNLYAIYLYEIYRCVGTVCLYADSNTVRLIGWFRFGSTKRFLLV